MRIKDTVEALAKPVIESLGLELWDIDFVKEAGVRHLRIYIDKADGVSIDDCEAVSRALDPVLDEADPIEESYVFEVSSAGIERELKRPGDFARFMGSRVEVRFYQSVNGRKSVIGSLSGYDAGDVTVETPAGSERFLKAQVAQVRLRADI